MLSIVRRYSARIAFGEVIRDLGSLRRTNAEGKNYRAMDAEVNLGKRLGTAAGLHRDVVNDRLRDAYYGKVS